MRGLIAGALMLAPVTVLAHAAAGYEDGTAPAVVFLLIATAAAAYLVGVRRLWRAAGRGRGATRSGAIAFLAGLGLLTLALAPPVESGTRHSFALHMLQHELLMLVVAPLLVSGRPLAVWTWALPRAARPGVAAALATTPVRVPWRLATSVGGALVLQLGLLFAWHLPALFDAAAANPDLHALQHACFLFPALAFWWSLLAPSSRLRPGPVLASLFVTMLATGALGAMLAVANYPWYATYRAQADALGDQQLGGLLMWVPGGTVYFVAALWLASRWIVRARAHAAAG